MQKQQGQQHDQFGSPSDDGSTVDESDISNENQIDQSETSPSEPGGSNENKSTTEAELTEEHETDNSKDHQTDRSESGVSESMHTVMSKTVSLPRKRKVKNPVKPLRKKRKRSHSMRNQNSSLTNVFDDHNVVGVLYSIKETLSNINSAFHKQILKSKSPWNRLDAFNFKHNYFLNLEECSQHYFAKPMKDVLTEEEMTFVDAVQSEQNLKELAILLNENQELFMKLINRFEMCNKNK